MNEKEGTASPTPQRSLSPGEKSSDSDKRSPMERKMSPYRRSRSRSRYSRGPRSVSRSSSRSPRHNRYRNDRYSRSRSPRRKPRYSRSRSRSYGRRYRSRSRSPYYRGGSPRRRSPYNGGGRRRSYRSRSRSRSGSPGYSGRRHGYSDRRRGFYRSHSHSPMSSRRRHVGNRENPTTSRCIGVFGLSLYTTERELKDVFGRYGPIDNINVVSDHHTNRSRGFAFIYYRDENDAIDAKERGSGQEIDGRKIRVDYSITHRAHTPTPGIYLGKPTQQGSRSNYRGRSASQEGYSGRRSRSRSRSYSYSPRGA